MNEQELRMLANLLSGKEIGYKVTDGDTAALTTSLIHGQGMFSWCGGNELISSLITDDAFSNWLGMTPSTVDPDFDKILSWIGPEGTEAGSPDWNRTSVCSDAPKVEWAKCELMTCFGNLARAGQDLSLTNLGLARCDEQPMYYVKGPHATLKITDDQTWQMAVAVGVLKMAFERMLVVGNHTANAMDFDGLMTLINTPMYDARNGLRCEGEEPYIYDWGSAAMTANICNILSDVARRIRRRGQYLGGIQRGDQVLMMTSLMRDALIDFMACGCGPCTGTQYNEVNIDPLSSRIERARLMNGGTYGMGMIEVDGIPIDILTNDWIPQTSTAPHFCSDIYLLTRRVGAMKILGMEYQDFASTLKGVSVPVESLVTGARVTDGGRFLTWSTNENECFNQTVLVKPRIRIKAPWLQARITSVCAPFNIPPITPIPGDVYFWPGATPSDAVGEIPYFYSGCT